MTFPDIADPSTLRIVLGRGPCMGDCPVYRVEIRGDGSVLYDGEGFVAIAGPHRARISKDSVERLVGAAVDLRDRDGETVLMTSADPQVTQVLLDAGADPFARDKRGRSVLERVGNSPAAAVLERWVAAHPQPR